MNIGIIEQDMTHTSSIMDAPIEEINVPILKPTKYTRIHALRRMAREYYVTLERRERVRARRVINRFADWVMAIPRGRERGGVHEVEAPLEGFLRTFRIDGIRGMDQQTFVNHVRARVVAFFARRQMPFQVQLIFACRYTRGANVEEGEREEEIPNFNSEVERVMEDTDLDELYDKMMRECLEKMDKFQKKGSGWRFEEVVSININVDPFNPMRAGSYFTLPRKLALKKAIINVQNEDNECFKWAVTSAVFKREKKPHRLDAEMRRNAARLDWDGIKFPTSLQQISKFEKQNPYSINVFGWTGTSVYSLRISKHENEQCINLLLLENKKNQHYCWIKDMSRLCASQYNSHKGKRFFCKYCCNSFASNETLENHVEYCSKQKAVKVVMPRKGGKLQFKNFHRKMRVPFVVYADFECFTRPISTCSQSDEHSYTKQYQKHKPCGYSYLIKCFNDELFSPVLKRFTIEKEDTNVAMSFVKSLEADIVDIYDEFKGKKENKNLGKRAKRFRRGNCLSYLQRFFWRYGKSKGSLPFNRVVPWSSSQRV